MGRIPEALACGRAAARQFGVDLPERAGAGSSAAATRDPERFSTRTAAIGIENLLDLPVMSDPGQIALIALAHALPAGGVSDRSGESYALLCCTMVRLSLEHGNCALVGARLRLVRGADRAARCASTRDAYRFAKLGVDLAHKFNETSMLVGRLFPVGDVRVALDQADRREHRPVSAEHPYRPAERRPRARGLQRRSPLLASAVPRHAARRAARGRQRHARDAASDQRCRQPRVRGAAPAAHRLAARRAAPRQHARQRTRTTRARARRRSRRAAIARSSADWFMLLTIQRYYAEDFDGALRVREDRRPVCNRSAPAS